MKIITKLKPAITQHFEVIFFLIMTFLLFWVDFSTDMGSEFYYNSADIYYEYQAARQFQDGLNPYNRILESNMLDNDKYLTQMPLYVYFLSAIRTFAAKDFSAFTDAFRFVLYWFHLAGGMFIFMIYKRSKQPFLGYCAALIYWFNVWSLNSFLYLKQDMVAIALLLISFYFFEDKKYSWLSYVLYGLSLGIKHIGIFVFPLYIAPLILKDVKPKQFVYNIGLLIATLLIPAIPLFIDNPTSFIKSMLFSLTRSPLDSEVFYGYSELLVTYNQSYNTGNIFQQLLPRLPLLMASLIGVSLLFLKKVPYSVYLFLSIMIFAIFNPVIFPQYITWVPPFALVSLAELSNKIKIIK